MLVHSRRLLLCLTFLLTLPGLAVADISLLDDYVDPLQVKEVDVTPPSGSENRFVVAAIDADDDFVLMLYTASGDVIAPVDSETNPGPYKEVKIVRVGSFYVAAATHNFGVHIRSYEDVGGVLTPRGGINVGPLDDAPHGLFLAPVNDSSSRQFVTLYQQSNDEFVVLCSSLDTDGSADFHALRTGDAVVNATVHARRYGSNVKLIIATRPSSLGSIALPGTILEDNIKVLSWFWDTAADEVSELGDNESSGNPVAGDSRQLVGSRYGYGVPIQPIVAGHWPAYEFSGGALRLQQWRDEGCDPDYPELDCEVFRQIEKTRKQLQVSNRANLTVEGWGCGGAVVAYRHPRCDWALERLAVIAWTHDPTSAPVFDLDLSDNRKIYDGTPTPPERIALGFDAQPTDDNRAVTAARFGASELRVLLWEISDLPENDDLNCDEPPGLEGTQEPAPDLQSLSEDPTSTVQALAFYSLGPNPSPSGATLQLELPERQMVKVGVYDAAGRLVRSVADELLESGTHTFSWDGRNATGRELASGVYIVRLEAGSEQRAVKVVLD